MKGIEVYVSVWHWSLVGYKLKCRVIRAVSAWFSLSPCNVYAVIVILAVISLVGVDGTEVSAVLCRFVRLRAQEIHSTEVRSNTGNLCAYSAA